MPVEWYPGYNTQVESESNTTFGFISDFKALVWVFVSISLLYFVLANIAIKYTEQGKLGKDESGFNATFRHPQFYLTKFLTTVGGALFMPIMKTYIDTQ